MREKGKGEKRRDRGRNKEKEEMEIMRNDDLSWLRVFKRNKTINGRKKGNNEV